MAGLGDGGARRPLRPGRAALGREPRGERRAPGRPRRRGPRPRRAAPRQAGRRRAVPHAGRGPAPRPAAAGAAPRAHLDAAVTRYASVRVRVPDEVGFAEHDGVRLAWERYGDGERTVL